MMLTKLTCEAIAASIILGVFYRAVVPPVDEPAVSAVTRRKELLSDFQFLRPPITEQKVNDFVTAVRVQLKTAKAADPIAQRDAYVKELARVLERFAVNDSMKENPTSVNDRTLWLSDRTAARVIRLLGDLNAVEAAETLVKFLLQPWDLELLRQQGPDEQPTTWALFQIGDASLPYLRKKMTSDGTWLPLRAAHTAAYILGPRADEQLNKWINEAETAEERERLAKYDSYLKGTTRQAERENLIAPEDYRRTKIEQGHRTLEKFLDRPTRFEIIEMEEKLRRAQANGKEDEQP